MKEVRECDGMINLISRSSDGEILILRGSVNASHLFTVYTGKSCLHTYVAPAAEAAVSSFEILFFSFLLLVPYTPIHEPSSSKRPEIRNSERLSKYKHYY